MKRIYFYGVLLSLWIVTVSGIAEPHQDPNPNKGRPLAVENPRKEFCWHLKLIKLEEFLSNGNSKYKREEIYKRDGFAGRLHFYKSVDPNDCGLVFAFTGTEDWNDWKHNLNFVPKGGDPYHEGFKRAAEKYAEKVLEEINKLPKKCTAPKITFTGHSLGGAIAYLMANANLNDELRTKLESFRPNTPELVLFGTPRVAVNQSKEMGFFRNFMRPNDTKTTPIDLSKDKTTHYYIDQDYIPVLPSSPLFQNLTDNNYQLEKIPVTEKVSETPDLLMQNHLPQYYVKRMEKLCNGEKNPIKTPPFNHNLLESLGDVLSRGARALKDKGKEKIKENVQEVIEAAKEVSENPRLIQDTILGTPDQPGNPEAWNPQDGRAFARTAACDVSSYFYSKTRNGRDRYCDGSGHNGTAQTKCGEMCKHNKGCVEGCYDQFSEFCRDDWDCSYNGPYTSGGGLLISSEHSFPNSPKVRYCIDQSSEDEKYVYMHPCHGARNQRFEWRDQHLFIKGKMHCLDLNPGTKIGNGFQVYLSNECGNNDNQKWKYEKGQLVSLWTDSQGRQYCLDAHFNKQAKSDHTGYALYAHPCNEGTNQVWSGSTDLHTLGPLQ